MRIIVTAFFLSCSMPLFGQEFWQQLNGPYGGVAAALSVKQDSELYVSTTGGAFRSNVQTAHWSILGNGLPNMSSFVFDGSTIYGAAPYHGLYRSTDNGNSWTVITNGLPASLYVKLLYFVNDSVLLAGTHLGVYRSTDKGDSWTYQGLSPDDIYSFAYVESTGNLFSGTTNGIGRSTDLGLTWTWIGGLPPTWYFALAVDSAGLLYAGSDGFGVLVSSDGGTSWVPKNTGLTSPYITALIVSPQNTVLATTHNGTFRSTNGGENWQRVTDGLLDDHGESLAATSEGFLYVGFMFAGVFRSTDDGTTWHQFNDHLTNAYVRSLLVDSAGTIFAGNRGNGIWRSTDDGDTWQDVNEGIDDGGVGCLEENSVSDLFAGCGGVSRSTDHGDTWEAVNNGLTNLSISAIAFNAQRHVFAGGIYMYRSTNNGNDWALITSGLPYGADNIVVSPNQDIFVGKYAHGMFRSTNNGDSWFAINNGLTNIGISSVVVNSLGFVFVSTQSGVFRSTNQGASWILLSSSPPNAGSLVVTRQDHLYVDVFGEGIYYSTNNGSSWSYLEGSLTDWTVIVLRESPAGFLYAGTDGGGVYKSLEPITSIHDPTVQVGHQILLNQNYPNPFNPSTRISYVVPKDGHVELKIFNVLGQAVRSLVDETMPKGSHSLVWDSTDDSGNSLSSGVYICRLRVGNQVQTRRMLFLK